MLNKDRHILLAIPRFFHTGLIHCQDSKGRLVIIRRELDKEGDIAYIRNGQEEDRRMIDREGLMYRFLCIAS